MCVFLSNSELTVLILLRGQLLVQYWIVFHFTLTDANKTVPIELLLTLFTQFYYEPHEY